VRLTAPAGHRATLDGAAPLANRVFPCVFLLIELAHDADEFRATVHVEFAVDAS
jgi:hypothetical protein